MHTHTSSELKLQDTIQPDRYLLNPSLYILSPPLVLFCCLNPSIFPLALNIIETLGNAPLYTSPSNLSSPLHLPQPPQLCPSILQSGLISPTCCSQMILLFLVLCLLQVSTSFTFISKLRSYCPWKKVEIMEM